MRKLFPVLLLLACSPMLRADAEARAKLIAPFLDEQTIAVAHVDLSRINVDVVATRLVTKLELRPDPFAETRKLLSQRLTAFTKAGGKDIYLIFSLNDFPDSFILVVPLQEGANVAEMGEFITGMGLADQDRWGSVLIAGRRGSLARLRKLKAPPRPELTGAFAALGSSVAEIVLLPNANLRRAVEELLPRLPEEAGGGSSSILTQGLSWAALGIETDPKLKLRLTLQAKDANAAKALHEVIETAIKNIGKDGHVRKLVPNFDKLAPLLVPTTQEDRLSLTLSEEQEEVAGLLAKLMVTQLRQANRQQTTNQMKQLGLALHNYHDVSKGFPPAALSDKQGKPLLSWRVAILPYLGEEKLYKEFHLDEPWDSEHNKKLITRMPATYRSGRARLDDAGQTCFLAPVGKDTMFTGESKGLGIRDVTDGTSNTIFLVEADDNHATVWTRPEDLKYDPEKPQTGLAVREDDRFVVLFVDGSVHVLPAKIDAKTLRALFTRNGGETVHLP